MGIPYRPPILTRGWPSDQAFGFHPKQTVLTTVPRSKKYMNNHVKGALAALPAMLAKNTERYRVAREVYSSRPVLCGYCNEPMPFEKKRRKFCSHSCAGSSNNKGVARNGKLHPWCGKIRPCLACDKPTSHYNRKYCSVECQTEYLYRCYILRWKAGEVDGIMGGDGTSKQIIKYLRIKFDNKCSKCGWCEVNLFTGNVPLQIHHVDGSYANNGEANLDLLCPNCHALTEYYGARNKGRGRPGRYERRTGLATIVQLAERLSATQEAPGS